MVDSHHAHDDRDSVDVVEYVGRTKRDSTIASFLHWYDADNTRYKVGGKFPGANRLRKRAQTWSQAYHVFSVEWTADALVFRVDGREYWRQTELVPRGPGVPPAVDAHVRLRAREADRAPDAPDGEGDWVRVWSSLLPLPGSRKPSPRSSAPKTKVTPTEGGSHPSSRSLGGVNPSGLKPVLSA